MKAYGWVSGSIGFGFGSGLIEAKGNIGSGLVGVRVITPVYRVRSLPATHTPAQGAHQSVFGLTRNSSRLSLCHFPTLSGLFHTGSIPAFTDFQPKNLAPRY